MDSSAYGAHSMRRTKAVQIYRKTGNLPGYHFSSDTRRSRAPYLGIEVDDALTLSEQVAL